MHERAPYRRAERTEPELTAHNDEAPRTSGYTDRFSEGRERAPRSRPESRQDSRPMVWFRLNIGRERNADPRWLLPLICKAGGVTKSDIGSIKIADRDTRFEIIAEIADQFAESVRVNPAKEGHIARADAPDAGGASDHPAERPARSERPRPERAARPVKVEHQREAPVEIQTVEVKAVEAPAQAVKLALSPDDKPFKAKKFKDKAAGDGFAAPKPYLKADKPYVKSDKPYVKKWAKPGADEPKSSGYVARDRAAPATSERPPRSRDDKPRAYEKKRDGVRSEGVKSDFASKSDSKREPVVAKAAFKGGGYKGAGAKGKFAAGPQPAAGYVARDMKSDRGEMSASKYASKKKQRETPPASSTG